jgi:hypothetical protein
MSDTDTGEETEHGNQSCDQKLSIMRKHDSSFGGESVSADNLLYRMIGEI